ncbi:hypothetical protein [Geobacillus thermodenitrificans]|jgi:hypothetical protein|uniref:hypothetical protein n=1 Tax=Geobacillus thermodenitrificans TaxID=33940 RepID=UPI002E21D863|nr:hypothetical protein [Geobacillus thermodenitrificans]
MKTPVILALIPMDNNIVRALIVHSETGEILFRKQYITVNLYDETFLDYIVADIEQTHDFYVEKLSLPRE